MKKNFPYFNKRYRCSIKRICLHHSKLFEAPPCQCIPVLLGYISEAPDEEMVGGGGGGSKLLKEKAQRVSMIWRGMKRDED